MKIFMLIGAIIGFLLGISLGLARHSDWPTTLWHGCLAAAGLGLLMRWWGGVWLGGLQTSLEQRRAAQLAARRPLPSAALPKK